jgi:hypothetical protein
MCPCRSPFRCQTQNQRSASRSSPTGPEPERSLKFSTGAAQHDTDTKQRASRPAVRTQEFPPGPEPRAQSPEFYFPPPPRRRIQLLLAVATSNRPNFPPAPASASSPKLRPKGTRPRRYVAVAGGQRGVLAAVAGPRLRRAHRAPRGGRGGATAAAAEGGAASARGRPLGLLLGAPPPGLAPRLPRLRVRSGRRAPGAPPRRARPHRLLLLHPVRSLHPPQGVVLPLPLGLFANAKNRQVLLLYT